MYGDENHYEKSLRNQQEAQRVRMINEQAGQQRLPIDMPQTSNLDPVEAARAAMNMTEDEKRLAGELLAFAVMLTIQWIDAKDEDQDALDSRMNKLLNKHENALITRHRAIVAKAVNDAKQAYATASKPQPLPSAGSF